MSGDQLWKVEKRRLLAGMHLNSPRIVTWLECGVIRAPDLEQAAVKACFAVGSSEIRVSPVDESYRPVSLLEG
jgi:hypothetical protein